MDKNDAYGFDKNVVLTSILQYKKLIFLILATSILSLLPALRFIAAISCLPLLMVTTQVLMDSYKWLTSFEELKQKKTFRQQRRLDYLNNLATNEEKLEVWSIILSDEKLSERNQLGLINAYTRTARSLEEDENWSLASFTSMMSQNIDKINLYYPDEIEDLTVFGLEYFKKYKEYRETIEKSIYSYPPHAQLEIYNKLLLKALSKDKRNILKYTFFKTVEEFANENDLISKIVQNLLYEVDDIDGLRETDILESYPKEWTVTTERLKDKLTKSTASSILQVYRSWANHKVRFDERTSQDEAESIDIIHSLIFPSLADRLFCDVIVFYNSGWGSQEGEDSLHAQVRGFAERNRKFGLWDSGGGGIMTTVGEYKEEEIWKMLEDKRQHAEKNTVYILGLLFPWLRNQSETKKVLDMVAEIKKNSEIYDEKTKDENYRWYNIDSLEDSFTKIQRYMPGILEEAKKATKTTRKRPTTKCQP